MILHSRFPQVAGIEFGLDPDADPEHRVIRDTVKVQEQYLREKKSIFWSLRSILQMWDCFFWNTVSKFPDVIHMLMPTSIWVSFDNFRPSENNVSIFFMNHELNQFYLIYAKFHCFVLSDLKIQAIENPCIPILFPKYWANVAKKCVSQSAINGFLNSNLVINILKTIKFLF